MAIRMRRGNEADFDPSKMLPGEWAVSTDTKYVRMCFSPGIVLRMATYEAFESDMAEIRNILLQCQNIQTAVELIQQNVTASELVIENYVKEAKQYRDEAEQFRNEAFSTTPEGYEDLVKNVSDNTVKIDTIIEKAELNIKNNAKGSNIHLTDSADSNVVELELYGKTEQNAYTGKNLLDCSGLSETTSNGVTFTPVYDANGSLECINVNGTANALVTYQVANKTKITEQLSRYIGEKIITSGCPSGGSTDTYYFNFQGAVWDGVGAMDTGNGIECTLSDFTGFNTVQIYLVIKGGFTANNLKFYPMVRLASTDETYEPYVGGKPSPSSSYQQEIKSVKGKNLLDCRGLTEQTTNEITFTPVYDENGNLLYINVNGKATEQANYYLMPATPFDKGSYIFSGCPTGGSGTTYSIYNDVSTGSDIGNGKELNFTDTTNVRLRIVISKDYIANNLKFYPMIRSASIKDDTYVPYGLLRIKTHGKNLVESCIYNATSVDYDAIIGEVNTNLKKGRTYTTSVDLTVQASTRVYWSTDAEVISNVSYQNVSNGTNRYSITFVAEKDSVNNKIWLKKANNGDNVLITPSNFMIEESPTMTEYQPYQSTEITLSEPIELNGFNGVYDVVTSDGVTRKFTEYTITGDENIYLHANGRIYVPINSLYNKVKAQGELLCTIASNDKSSNVNSNGYYCNLGGAGVYFACNDVFETAEDFINYVKSNTVKCLIELATPTTEELPTDFTVLKTFYPETHVSNDADCDMSITYTADAKNYIDNKIALLTTALYNNI